LTEENLHLVVDSISPTFTMTPSALRRLEAKCSAAISKAVTVTSGGPVLSSKSSLPSARSRQYHVGTAIGDFANGRWQYEDLGSWR
jgi:hypothetical protein